MRKRMCVGFAAALAGVLVPAVTFVVARQEPAALQVRVGAEGPVPSASPSGKDAPVPPDISRGHFIFADGTSSPPGPVPSTSSAASSSATSPAPIEPRRRPVRPYSAVPSGPNCTALIEAVRAKIQSDLRIVLACTDTNSASGNAATIVIKNSNGLELSALQQTLTVPMPMTAALGGPGGSLEEGAGLVVASHAASRRVAVARDDGLIVKVELAGPGGPALTELKEKVRVLAQDGKLL